MGNTLTKKTQKKVMECLDNIFGCDIPHVANTVIFCYVYLQLAFLIGAGIRYRIFESYFEVIIGMVFILFLLEKTFWKMEQLDERWELVILGLLIGFGLLLVFNIFLIIGIVISYTIVVGVLTVLYQYIFREEIELFLKKFRFN